MRSPATPLVLDVVCPVAAPNGPDDCANPAGTTFLIKGLVGLRQEIRDYTP